MRGIAVAVDWGILWVLTGFTHVDHLGSAERSGPEDGCLSERKTGEAEA